MCSPVHFAPCFDIGTAPAGAVLLILSLCRIEHARSAPTDAPTGKLEIVSGAGGTPAAGQAGLAFTGLNNHGRARQEKATQGKGHPLQLTQSKGRRAASRRPTERRRAGDGEETEGASDRRSA